MRAKLLILIVGLTVLPHLARAGEPTVIDVWPGKPANDNASKIGAEYWRPPRPGDKWQKWVTNVTRPTLTLYRPDPSIDTGAAVLICPGGGYWDLMWDLEGEEVAAWLNSLGVTGIILKYRCPRRPGEPEKLPAPGPLLDAQRAVSLVRSKANEWNLDPRRIGMIGFSAGGHLVAATATNFSKRAYTPIDAVDQFSCRPDFAIMAYSGYLYEFDRSRITPTTPLVKDAPPLFLVHAADDKVSKAAHSIQFAQAFDEIGVSTELHIFSEGGHGFGVRQDGNPASGWTKLCADWMKRNKFLAPQPIRSTKP